MNINCLCLYLLCFNCSKVEYMWLHAGDDSNCNYLNKSLALEGGDNRDASMIIPSILWSGGLTSGRFDDCHSKSCPFNNPINLTTFCFCLELSRLYFVITLTGLSLTYCAPCYQRSCNVTAWAREQQYIYSDNHVRLPDGRSGSFNWLDCDFWRVTAEQILRRIILDQNKFQVEREIEMAKQRSVVTINRNHRAFVTLESCVNSCGRYGERNVRLWLRYVRSN